MKEFGFTSMDSNPTNIIFSKEQFHDQAPDKKKEVFEGHYMFATQLRESSPTKKKQGKEGGRELEVHVTQKMR